MKRPDISFDDDLGIMTLAGVKYSYEFVEDLGVHGIAEGAIVERTGTVDGQPRFQRHFGFEKGRAIRCIALATLLRAANRPYEAKELGDLASIALEGEP